MECNGVGMPLVLINLERAEARRLRMEKEFASLGLSFEIRTAIDGRRLTADHYALIDRDARRSLGLYPLPDGSIANWLTQRQAMRDLVENGPEMMAVFEDDARLTPALPKILSILEERRFAFDIVFLHRRNPGRTFIPCIRMDEGHALGRVRYADYGSESYVITRAAARHFLETTPIMVREIDQSLSRFWDNGLNIFYVDPPIVHSDGAHDSQIEDGRIAGRRDLYDTDHRHHRALVLWRRTVSGIRRGIRKRLAFRRLMRGEIGVTAW